MFSLYLPSTNIVILFVCSILPVFCPVSCLVVCRLVYFSSGLHKNYRSDLHWTWLRDGPWAREEPIKFWGGSGSFTLNLNFFLWSLLDVVWHWPWQRSALYWALFFLVLTVVIPACLVQTPPIACLSFLEEIPPLLFLLTLPPVLILQFFVR